MIFYCYLSLQKSIDKLLLLFFNAILFNLSICRRENSGQKIKEKIFGENKKNKRDYRKPK